MARSPAAPACGFLRSGWRMTPCLGDLWRGVLMLAHEKEIQVSYLGITLLGITLSRTTLLIIGVVVVAVVVAAWYMRTRR